MSCEFILSLVSCRMRILDFVDSTAKCVDLRVINALLVILNAFVRTLFMFLATKVRCKRHFLIKFTHTPAT